MKKLLLVLGILSIGALGFADPKSDFENAQKNGNPLEKQMAQMKLNNL